MFSAAIRHLPPGVIPLRKRDSWIIDYISHYKDIIDATSEDTKTTPYKRLLNMLKNDYDDVGALYAEQYKEDVYESIEDQPIMPFSEKRSKSDSNIEEVFQKAMKYLEQMDMTRVYEVK